MATFYGNIRMRSESGETVYADSVRDLPALLAGHTIASVHEYNHTLRKYKPAPSALRWVCEQRGQEAPAASAEQPRNPQIAADFAQMRQLMDDMGYTPEKRRRAVEGFVASAPAPAPRTSPRQRGNTSPLAEARMAAGLTQAQLAQKVGCTQKDISRWEHGIYTPSAAYAVSLADALGFSVEHLINA
jgi:putative transcriptional regulator